MADYTFQHVPGGGATDPIFAALRQQLLGAPAGPTTPIFQSVADHMPGGASFQPQPQQGGGAVRSFEPVPALHSFPMSPFPPSVGAMTHSFPVPSGGGMNRSFGPQPVSTQDGFHPSLPQGDTPIDWNHVPNTLRHFA